MESMSWDKLLNNTRLGGRPPKSELGRSPFHSDHDKVVFSGAFRRLARKTQVHPLATNDHVHNRLTHSLEVACVGRTLGVRVGQEFLNERLIPEQHSASDKWSWDLALYMSFADIQVFENGRNVGQALYDSTSGGARMGKFIDAQAKIIEMTQQLFPDAHYSPHSVTSGPSPD